jgi:hypothetical protein
MEPVSPRTLNPRVPRDLETITLKCLQKDPSKRYSDARALCKELDRFLRGEPIEASPASAPEKFWRWCKRKPALAVSASIAALLFVSGASGVLVTWHVHFGVDRGSAKSLRADMNLAMGAHNDGNPGRVRELLEKHRPRAGSSTCVVGVAISLETN